MPPFDSQFARANDGCGVRYTVIYDTHNRKVHTCLQLFIPSYREYIILSDNLQLKMRKKSLYFILTACRVPAST